jgi:kynureninase
MNAEELARHYSRFRVTERVLLTGHSHQAWPDVAAEGQREAFDAAADFVDGKWDHAFAKAERVRDGFRALLGEPRGEIALGASTHDLVLRFLSALDLRARPRIVTTTGEFHTLRRQLGRLGEAGIEVVRVDVDPVDTLAERVAHAVDEFSAAVFVSSVLFASSRIVPGLPWLARACEHHGAELLVDAYHQLGAVPFDLGGLEAAWIVGGGYKYLQLGEGNCFLRLPPQAQQLRPAITGWYAEFDSLAASRAPTETQYSSGGQRFAGATYDPTSHYRAARVFDFFDAQGLTPHVLRGISLHQTTLIAERLGLDEPREHFGGFVALSTPRAAEYRDALLAERVHTDTRGDVLRLGPAPYVSDAQLHGALDALTAMMQ